MRWLLSVVVAIVVSSIGIAPSFAQTQTYNIPNPQEGGQPYAVNYDITSATVDDISINSQDTSLVISITTTGDGTLTMTLPRSVIDAKFGNADDQFFVLVDGADSDFDEKKTSTDRTITVSFPDGTQQIEIIGTQVVPEFGGLSFAILLVAILSVVIFSTRHKLKIGL